jgi:uncharacterized protein YggE
VKKLLSTTWLAAVMLCATTAGAAEVGTFVASGIGRAVAKPDIMFFQIGFKSEGKTPGEAVNKDAASAAKVAAVLRQQGLLESDLETNGYTIEEIMGPDGCGEYRNGEPRIACSLEGYRLSNSITVRIRNLDNYAPILTGAIEAGLKDISRITFAVSDEQRYYDEAFAKALLAAKDKAELTARTLGFRLGRLVDVGANIAPPQWGHQTPATLADGLGDANDYGEADLAVLMPLISSGEMTFTREASVTYEIVPGP